MSLIIVKFVNVMMDLMIMVWQLVFSFMSCVVSLELMRMPMGILVLVETMVTLVMEERSKVVGISKVNIWSMEVSDAVILLGHEASESFIGCLRVFCVFLWSLIGSMLNSDRNMNIVLMVFLYNHSSVGVTVMVRAVIHWVVVRSIISSGVSSIFIINWTVSLMYWAVMVSEPITMVIVMLLIEDLSVEWLLVDMMGCSMIMERIIIDLVINIIEIGVWYRIWRSQWMVVNVSLVFITLIMRRMYLFIDMMLERRLKTMAISMMAIKIDWV